MKTFKIARKKKAPPVKADQALKLLFQGLSKKPRIDLINGLFGESFREEQCIIEDNSTESIDADLNNKFIADFKVTVTEGSDVKRFHVEFQTRNDSSMVVRMFTYGFQMAEKTPLKIGDELVYEFPHQLVLYLERDDKVLDT